jgi:hypothetical protein
MVGACHGALKPETIDIRQGYVENQAAWATRLAGTEIFGGGGEGDAMKISGREQIYKRFAHPEVVIDEEDRFGLLSHLEASRRGQSECENCSPGRVVPHPQFALVRLNDRTTDCQADAHSILLGAVEGFEGLLLIGDPGAGIADLDNHPAVDVPRTNDQSFRIALSFHCLDPIPHQV